ncbi:TRML2 protein, partial [Onychorhynchus coronatus]|nr:TRML2 protein [Onychorhynchus coronatus]
LQAQAPHAEERRREGGTLHIQCPYTDKTYSQQWKAWCRLKNKQCYDSLVMTSYQDMSQTRDKITIMDDPTAKTVSVTMTNLRAQDSGTYLCAVSHGNSYFPLKTISLNVFKGEYPYPHTKPSLVRKPHHSFPCSNVNTFIPLSVVLSILLILTLLTSVMLCVRLHKLLERTGNRGAEDTYDYSEGTAQLGSTERRESSKDDSKGLKHMNLDLQSQPGPENPLYCNIEPRQAHRNPPGEDVEYAVIAFNQFPRNDAG